VEIHVFRTFRWDAVDFSFRSRRKVVPHEGMHPWAEWGERWLTGRPKEFSSEGLCYPTHTNTTGSRAVGRIILLALRRLRACVTPRAYPRSTNTLPTPLYTLPHPHTHAHSTDPHEIGRTLVSRPSSLPHARAALDAWGAAPPNPPSPLCSFRRGDEHIHNDLIRSTRVLHPPKRAQG
jgi:hypothetical protein